MAKLYGARTLELNAKSTLKSTLFDETRIGPATAIVPTFVDEMLKNNS